MRILLVGALFPPENAISAVRLGKFAQYLAESGHSIRVVAREPATVGVAEPDYAQLAIEVIRYRDPLAKAEKYVKPRVAEGSVRDATAARFRNSATFNSIKRAVSAVLFWPDRFVGWAVRAARGEGGADWNPDVIVASGPPFSAMLVGAWLAKMQDVPWVADYRDLLAFGPYSQSGRLRGAVERTLERRIVRTASGIVTVSAPLAEDLERVFGSSVDVVMNGFDPEDFVGLKETAPCPSEELVITYCGEIYHEKRDPGPLFRAMAQLRGEGVQVRARFFGNSVGIIDGLAKRDGVRDLVEINPRVSRTESLRLQRESDVLLMLMWNDPRERGVYSGKIFEYIGSLRPILMLGYEHGVAAELIESRSAGVVANDADSIAGALRSWAKVRRTGLIPSVSTEAQEGLTRREQTATLESVLQRAARASFNGI